MGAPCFAGERNEVNGLSSIREMPLAGLLLRAGNLRDQLCQIDFKRSRQCVKHDEGRVADAAFEVIDHRAADAGEPRQLALGNAAFLADFLEGSNECAGKLF